MYSYNVCCFENVRQYPPSHQPETILGKIILPMKLSCKSFESFQGSNFLDVSFSILSLISLHLLKNFYFVIYPTPIYGQSFLDTLYLNISTWIFPRVWGSKLGRFVASISFRCCNWFQLRQGWGLEFLQ